MTPTDIKAAREWLSKFEHGECESSQFMAMTQHTLHTILALAEKVMNPSEGMIDHARTAAVAANVYAVGKFELPEAKERVLLHAAFQAMIQQAIKEIQEQRP